MDRRARHKGAKDTRGRRGGPFRALRALWFKGPGKEERSEPGPAEDRWLRLRRKEGEGADLDALARRRVSRHGRVVEGGVCGKAGAAVFLRIVAFDQHGLVAPLTREVIPA